MNFQLPKQDEDFDYYGNSSQDESKGSQGRQFSLLENFHLASFVLFFGLNWNSVDQFIRVFFIVYRRACIVFC